MRKDVEIIRDPKAIKIGVEDTRGKILSLLRVDDMTISQIAEALSKDQSTIYRHIKKLEEAGFIEVSGERKEHHIPEKLYGRTASLFLLSPRTMEAGGSKDLELSWEKTHAKKIVEIMNKMGYDNDADEELIKDLSELFARLCDIMNQTIESTDKEVGEMDYPMLVRLRLLFYLLEIEENEDLKEKTKNILSKFQS